MLLWCRHGRWSCNVILCNKITKLSILHKNYKDINEFIVFHNQSRRHGDSIDDGHAMSTAIVWPCSEYLNRYSSGVCVCLGQRICKPASKQCIRTYLVVCVCVPLYKYISDLMRFHLESGLQTNRKSIGHWAADGYEHDEILIMLRPSSTHYCSQNADEVNAMRFCIKRILRQFICACC